VQRPTRKVTAALEIWRRWPNEIEFDLLNLPAPVDIADWLQGTRDVHGRMVLSSRRLLLILNHLPDSSRFKTEALRDGDWTHDQEVAAATHFEAAKLRASFVASNGGDGEDAQYVPFESPVAFRERLKELMAEAEIYGDQSLDSMYDNLFGE
jgi:hypothetical protein